MNVGKVPMEMTCPHCQTHMTTTIRPETGIMQYVAAGLLCVLGCCLCALIPLCNDDWRDVAHYCPNCQAFVGKYNHNF